MVIKRQIVTSRLEELDRIVTELGRYSELDYDQYNAVILWLIRRIPSRRQVLIERVQQGHVVF